MAELNEQDPYIAWIGCLNAIGDKVRRYGLLAIEGDVEFPNTQGSPFSQFPQTLREPYLGFACDILRLMLGGMLNQPANIDLYIETALLSGRKLWFWQRPDSNLLRLIGLTLKMLSDGHAPRVACEFGRQAIPPNQRPSFNDLECWLKKQRYQRQEASDDLLSEKRISEFLKSIGATN